LLAFRRFYRHFIFGQVISSRCAAGRQSISGTLAAASLTCLLSLNRLTLSGVFSLACAFLLGRLLPVAYSFSLHGLLTLARWLALNMPLTVGVDCALLLPACKYFNFENSAQL